LPLYPFYYIFSYSSRFVLLFHSPSSYLGPYILLNIFLLKKISSCFVNWMLFFFNVVDFVPACLPKNA
jgi:hypothetical protein